MLRSSRRRKLHQPVRKEGKGTSGSRRGLLHRDRVVDLGRECVPDCCVRKRAKGIQRLGRWPIQMSCYGESCFMNKYTWYTPWESIGKWKYVISCCCELQGLRIRGPPACPALAAASPRALACASSSRNARISSLTRRPLQLKLPAAFRRDFLARPLRHDNARVTAN